MFRARVPRCGIPLKYGFAQHHIAVRAHSMAKFFATAGNALDKTVIPCYALRFRVTSEARSARAALETGFRAASSL